LDFGSNEWKFLTQLFSQEVFMTDQISDEIIYTELEDIRRRAEIIRDSHCAMLLSIQPQPRVSHGCLVLDKKDVVPDVYRALVDMARRVSAVADEYAAFYQIPK
jgi:P2-related tail formation protein